MARTVMCKNCKFWSESKTDEAPVESNTLAVALDYEGWEAWLVTRADFACNQGERK